MKVLSTALVGISLLATIAVGKPIDGTAELEPIVQVGTVNIFPPNVSPHGCIPAMGSCAEDKIKVDDVVPRSVESDDKVQTETNQGELAPNPVQDTASTGGDTAVTDAAASRCIPDLWSCGKDENCCSKMCRWSMIQGYICIPNNGEWGNAAEIDAIQDVDTKHTDPIVSAREEAESTACALDHEECDEDKDCCSKFCRWGGLYDGFTHVCQPSVEDPEDSSKSCIPPGGSCADSKDCCDKKCIGWSYYRCGG